MEPITNGCTGSLKINVCIDIIGSSCTQFLNIKLWFVFNDLLFRLKWKLVLKADRLIFSRMALVMNLSYTIIILLYYDSDKYVHSCMLEEYDISWNQIILHNFITIKSTLNQRPWHNTYRIRSVLVVRWWVWGSAQTV